MSVHDEVPRTAGQGAAVPDAPGVGTYAWRVAQDALEWSAGLLELHGQSAPPPAAQCFTASVHPGDRARVAREAADSLAGASHYAREFRIVRPDGRIRHVHDRGTIERDAAGAVVRVNGLRIDVTEQVRQRVDETERAHETERARLGRALRDSERFARTVLEADADCIAVLDESGTVVFANRRARERLLAFPGNGAIGLPWRDAWPAAARPAMDAAIDAVRRGEERTLRAAGAASAREPTSWELDFVPLSGERAGARRAFVVCRDVTERARVAQPDPAEARGAPPAPKAGVLIVEDELLVALDIKRVVEESGYRVVGPARSVEEAFAQLDRQGCACAVLDINLGRETSEAVARRLMRDAVPFVVMSGYARSRHPEVFKTMPYLEKPVRDEQLLAMLGQMSTAAS